MIIREITLDKYRTFAQPHTFNFGERFTVIAGVNGKGKTTILDGVATLLSRLLPQISPANSGFRKISYSDIHNESEEAQLIARVFCVDTLIEFKFRFNKERKRQTPTKLPQAVRDHVRAVYGDPKRADDQAPLVVYYTVDRAGYRLPRKLPTDIPQGQSIAYHKSLSNRLVDYRDFMARYRLWSMQCAGTDEKAAMIAKRAIKSINTALEVFLDGFSDLEVLEDPLRLTIKKNGGSLSLGQLSDGERSFLAMLSDLIRRLVLANPHLENPLLGKGIVLIDEIELHLHPKWQREIIENLKMTFPNIQFIATTHSPFIIQTLNNDELIVLDDLIIGNYENRGLDEIVMKVMGIEDPNASPRYFKMLDAAKEYFQQLEEVPSMNSNERARLKQKLDGLARPYADNPAYQALLELEKVKVFKE
jgi:predicted ATP-binding protein involved in virulence